MPETSTFLHASKLDKHSKIIASPNPTTGIIHLYHYLDANQMTTLKVFDVMGTVVLEYKPSVLLSLLYVRVSSRLSAQLVHGIGGLTSRAM